MRPSAAHALPTLATKESIQIPFRILWWTWWCPLLRQTSFWWARAACLRSALPAGLSTGTHPLGQAGSAADSEGSPAFRWCSVEWASRWNCPQSLSDWCLQASGASSTTCAVLSPCRKYVGLRIAPNCTQWRCSSSPLWCSGPPKLCSAGTRVCWKIRWAATLSRTSCRSLTVA